MSNAITTPDGTELMKELLADEGLKLKPYKDTMGKITIGIGRNLTDVGITQAEAVQLMWNDVAICTKELDATFPWWRSRPPNVQRVIVNMCFNMGITKLRQWTTFLSLVQTGDYLNAADDLTRNPWWHQVGERGPRMYERLCGAPYQPGVADA